MTLDYKLARDLSDAGFPQEGRGTWIGDPAAIVMRRADRVYLPTLSELIAACGKCGLLPVEPDGWEAVYPVGQNPYRDASHVAFGSTPEEAVAHLWLALNGKV
jgi:hypothetical protein